MRNLSLFLFTSMLLGTGCVRALTPEQVKAQYRKHLNETINDLRYAGTRDGYHHIVHSNGAVVARVAIKDLLANKEQYKGRTVEVAGYYVGTFEHYVLYESKEQKSITNALWIHPFRDRPGYRQNVPGRGEFRGKVRIVGTFDYHARYGSGHLNGWPAQITDLVLFEKVE